MAFNSADTAAFKNVWVFCEQRQGVMMPTTFELISEGRKLANELGVELCGILLGDNVDGIAAELGEYGADKVYVYNSPLLKDFTTGAYTKVIVEAVEELKPEVLLFGASNIGRDLAPRCAARLHTGLCADCTHLDIDMPNYKGFLREASTLPEERIEKLGTVMINREPHDVSRDLKMTRPAFGGHLMASIICPRFRPAMATVRPGVMKKRECKKNVEILHPAFALEAADIHTEVTETVKAAKKLVDLIGADFIVSVGRGISKDVEGGIKLAEELAEVLGGVVVPPARACVDAGWISADHQVGQTGKTVHPKVYIALGDLPRRHPATRPTCHAKGFQGKGVHHRRQQERHRSPSSTVAEKACVPGSTIHNLPFEVTADMVADALLAADAMGRAYRKAN